MHGQLILEVTVTMYVFVAKIVAANYELRIKNMGAILSGLIFHLIPQKTNKTYIQQSKIITFNIRVSLTMIYSCIKIF